MCIFCEIASEKEEAKIRIDERQDSEKKRNRSKTMISQRT